MCIRAYECVKTQGEGCGVSVELDCAATDICQTPGGLFFSYDDAGVDLEPARACVERKCPALWRECAVANGHDVHPRGSGDDTRESRTEL
jgi:hypothetical protein